MDTPTDRAKSGDGPKVELVIDDRVARIVLNNPPLNLLTLETVQEISRCIQEAVQTEALCAIVFEPGESCKAFCAGFALDEFRLEASYQTLDSFHSLFRDLDYYAKPTVAVVPDGALGAGFELAAYCDIVLAGSKARFGLPEVKMGVFPAHACVYLPRIIGQKRARELILTGNLVSAADAKEMGLVSHVILDDQLEQSLQIVLNQFRGLSATVLEAAKRALVQASNITVEEGLAVVEDIYLNQLMNLKDPGEGLIAFREKRAPRWRHK